MVEKFILGDLNISDGKKTRLAKMMYDHGPGNGKLMILPIDQGLEHGPIDFLDNPEAENPGFQFELAVQGNFSAIACHIGLAEKYYPDYQDKIPLVLKVNGREQIYLQMKTHLVPVMLTLRTHYALEHQLWATLYS